MTVGTNVTGSVSPYYSGTYRNWSGGDSPGSHDQWNPYVMQAFVRSVHPNSLGNRMGAGMPSGGGFTADDELRLLDKLSEAVRGHEFNAGVFLGQAGEVASSVVGTANAFRGIARSLKRGDLSGATRFLSRAVSGSDLRAAKKRLDVGDLAGTHLSLVYGWLPLLSDVHAACEALEVLANPPRRSTVVVTRSRRTNLDGSQSPTLYYCSAPKVVSRRIQYRMTEELSMPRSLGLLDPVSVAWELVPYSFVVDWFVPIGTYLSNLAVIPFLKGDFLVTDRVRWAARCITTSAGAADFDGGSCNCSETTINRRISSSLSVPLPTFRGFASLYNSSQRCANALALLVNLYRK